MILDISSIDDDIQTKLHDHICGYCGDWYECYDQDCVDGFMIVCLDCEERNEN